MRWLIFDNGLSTGDVDDDDEDDDDDDEDDDDDYMLWPTLFNCLISIMSLLLKWNDFDENIGE